MEHHHESKVVLKFRDAEGKIGENDAENADTAAAHFELIFNNHKQVEPTILDELEHREEAAWMEEDPASAELKKC